MTRASRLAFWLATAALVAASMMTPAAQLKRPSTVKTQAKPVPQPPASSISAREVLRRWSGLSGQER